MSSDLRVAPSARLHAALAVVALATSATTPSWAAGPEVSTIPFIGSLTLRSATYTPSGRVLVSYAPKGEQDRRRVNLATMDDDGRTMRPFFSGTLPARDKANGIRLMVFADNRRIFLGDDVVECSTSLETCSDAVLRPVVYPPELAGGDHISRRWSEIVVAPDNLHIAWTTLLANLSAMVSIGELRREGEGYRIVGTRVVSTLEPFRPDPAHPDGVLPQLVRGGEVKQFVRGGTALSLVGSVGRDTPNSVVQDLATGRMESITDTAGYTETTIFSPDERRGLTMTTRFSKTSDPAILGLLPRPYPASLNMGLSMLAYTYAVTGVRRGRPGSVGPALIDLAASRMQDGYLGLDLSRDPEWIFLSPMSWHPGGAKAMWIETRRGQEVRMRMVRVGAPRPGKPVPAMRTPGAGEYATSDLSAAVRYAQAKRDIEVKVYGRASGYIRYRRTSTGVTEKIYANFSDDGRSVYSGSERLAADPHGRSTYTAKLALAGPKPGAMDLTIMFGPLAGERPAEIIFAPDASGAPSSRGYAEYGGRRLRVADLVP